MLVTCKLSESVMCHTLMQQGTLDVRFPPGMRKIQADTLRGDVIPATDVFPAGEQAAYVGRACLVGMTDHFHRNVQFPGQKRHMTCELVHPDVP